jgi:hypothetical protein
MRAGRCCTVHARAESPRYAVALRVTRERRARAAMVGGRNRLRPYLAFGSLQQDEVVAVDDF